MQWKISRLLLVVVLFSLQDSCYGEARSRRQVSLDDLIQGALQLVKPIFDTSQPIRNIDNSMIPKQSASDDPGALDYRQKAALGLQEDTMAAKDSPICRGNSQICKFIACSAHNFKHDQNFANLNLAAQLISDKQLRKTITNNPEAVVSVCREQGLSDSQCKMFAQGFQVIDKFFNVVEPKPGEIVEDTTEATSSSIAQNKLHEMDDDPSPMVAPLRPPLPRRISPIPMMGSRTWSTHINPVLSSHDSLLPRPIIPMMSNTHRTAEKRTPFADAHISTTPLHVPTAHVPTSPVVPVAKRPTAQVPPQAKNSHSGYSTGAVITRPRRFLSYDDPFSARDKREADYYDLTSSSSTPQPSGLPISPINMPAEAPSGSGDGGDYYDNLETSENQRPSSVTSTHRGGSSFTPMNCLSILG